jgi:endonuclease G
MRRNILVIVLLVFSIFEAFPCELPHHYDFETETYIGCYDATHKVPHYVEWTLTGEMVQNNTDVRPTVSFAWTRDGNRLEKELRLNGEEILHDSDYVNTGFDRGHIAPNEDFDDTLETATSTFFMANVAPQYPRFNRNGGIWYESELAERRLALEYGTVVVRVEITEFEGSWTGAKVRMAVPSHFMKTIGHRDGEARYRLPNVPDGGGRDLSRYGEEVLW